MVSLDTQFEKVHAPSDRAKSNIPL